MRILHIEDDPTLRQYLARGLSEAGYSVVSCADGREGLARAREPGFDALIVDWQLPGLEGVAVIRSLRDSGMAIPILLLTVRDQIRDRVEGLDSGADDYLVKPFAFEELLARLRAMTRRAPLATGGRLRVRRLTVDPVTRLAAWDGCSLPLTHKEFALLEFLARRAGEAVPKTVIHQGVWDRDYEPRGNLLEVFIARLRKKLGDAGAPDDFLSTVKRVGYRLGGEP